MQPISKENRGFRYILVVVDVLSRYVFAVPIKDKTGNSVVNAFEKIFSKYKRIPKKVQTDDGTEYFNANFKSFLRKKNIIHYSTSSDVKAAIAERFIRTLKAKIYKYFTAKKTLHYLQVLPKLIHGYNHRVHSAHKKRPVDVTKKTEKEVWKSLYGDYLQTDKHTDSKFKVGDIVRLTKIKRTFKKSYLKGWTDELFIVTEILKTKPLTYKIKDLTEEVLKGSFYKEELTKVLLK